MTGLHFWILQSIVIAVFSCLIWYIVYLGRRAKTMNELTRWKKRTAGISDTSEEIVNEI